MQPASRFTGKYRRNGKLESCEPCRKSKLKCDHVVPACGRCVKRGWAERCIYHPSPMSRRRQSSIPSPTSPVVLASPGAVDHRTEPTPLADASVCPGDVLLTDNRPLSPVAETPSNPRRENHDEPAVISSNAGFVGATSYSTIFAEGLGNLESVSRDLEAPQRRDVTVSNDSIVRGCQVLSFLRGRAMVDGFIWRFYEMCEGSGGVCIEFIMKEWLAGLWGIHGDVLKSQDPEGIRRLSEMIWRNTHKPLVFDGKTTAVEWARLGTGAGLRWEVIGLVAVIVGLCAHSLDPSDWFLSEHRVTQQAVSRTMSEVSQTCLSFCRDCESLDDMFIWLLIEHAWLISAVKGDRNYATYHAKGETINAVVAMGLHQGIKASQEVPFFLAELRKRSFMEAYCIEISISAFLGRPPRLSYRYCTTDTPLDLADNQLVLEGADLAAALAGLDKDGYNSAGRMYRITCMRTFLAFAPRREDILDLALGDYTREQILERAAWIERKSDEHWARLPSFVVRARDPAVDLSKTKPLETLYSSSVRQGTRANELLLQRVLMRRAGVGPERLIRVARAIFSDILQITQRHDIASMFRTDFTALLVAHGLRSGAIIAVELLKQEMMSVPLATPGRNTPAKPPLLPRSQTIQDLSVFAARLGTVDSSDGSFGMCDQGRKIITRILDKILTPAPAPPAPAPAPRESNTPGTPIVDSDGNTQPCQCQCHQQTQVQSPTQTDVNEVADQNRPPDPGLDNALAPGTALDFGIAFDDPLSLGHDTDFMQWLESMDWERAGTWSSAGLGSSGALGGER